MPLQQNEEAETRKQMIITSRLSFSMTHRGSLPPKESQTETEKEQEQ